MLFSSASRFAQYGQSASEKIASLRSPLPLTRLNARFERQAVEGHAVQLPQLRLGQVLLGVGVVDRAHQNVGDLRVGVDIWSSNWTSKRPKYGLFVTPRTLGTREFLLHELLHHRRLAARRLRRGRGLRRERCRRQQAGRECRRRQPAQGCSRIRHHGLQGIVQYVSAAPNAPTGAALAVSHPPRPCRNCALT